MNGPARLLSGRLRPSARSDNSLLIATALECCHSL
jgi:hypothetical protein